MRHPVFFTESSKSPAGVAQSNKQVAKRTWNIRLTSFWAEFTVYYGVAHKTHTVFPLIEHILSVYY